MQIIEFTTCDPSVATSTLSATLHYVEGGTDIQEVPDGLSSLIALDDNKLGRRNSLGKLAAKAEAAR
ncbi:hypothetical protein ABZW96_26385 [Nocardia sp. NPDC004168]|uniref:hypothetical protein n=1 Tax=Nocardia sp. NPDC004168 TaxID=3154452 RepID=UPI0033B73854